MFRFSLLLCMLLTVAASAQASALIESKINVQGPNGPLVGTITTGPLEVAPVALILPGSGPIDRDGNSPLGINASTYKLLAADLAANGITTLRIDKRGMFGSAQAVPDPNAVTIRDYVEDTGSWVAKMKEVTGAKCIWLIGHSEGGLVALSAVQRIKDVCGLVLVATPGRTFSELLKAQLRANPANSPLIETADAIIDELAAGREVTKDTIPAALWPVFNPAVQNFLISLMELDPAKLAKSANRPILIVQGGKDLQVSLEDARILGAAAPNARTLILPNANHVLKDIEGENLSDNFAAYADSTRPVSAGLVASIANFILARK